MTIFNFISNYLLQALNNGNRIVEKNVHILKNL